MDPIALFCRYEQKTFMAKNMVLPTFALFQFFTKKFQKNSKSYNFSYYFSLHAINALFQISAKLDLNVSGSNTWHK